jgi:UDPglucose--hexose-1-phosphate uridylyltransferase
MSILRQDPTTKDWVIIATDRGKRPDDFQKTPAESALPTHDPACPFCPGQENLTPPDIIRYPHDSPLDWRLRVVPNKYAAVGLNVEPYRKEEGHFFREMGGVGHHEVIIETPQHNRSLSRMTTNEVELVLQASHERYCALKQDPQVKSIVLFKNHGERAGTSLIHPHSQIVGTPVAPLLIRKKYEVAISHFDDTGRCLYRDLVDAERSATIRLLFESTRFVVFHPFASRVPFETWIAPKYEETTFGLVEPGHLAELADVLRRTLKTLDDALGNPDFNYILHSAPPEDESKHYFLWHIQILPRLTTIAGFELGSGIFINTILPEDAATHLKKFLQ